MSTPEEIQQRAKALAETLRNVIGAGEHQTERFVSYIIPVLTDQYKSDRQRWQKIIKGAFDEADYEHGIRVAALKEDLEQVEKERDEAREIARDRDARVEQSHEWGKACVSMKAELTTLRADISRKDAALRVVLGKFSMASDSSQLEQAAFLTRKEYSQIESALSHAPEGSSR